MADPIDREYVPGSFGCHEALHLSSVFRDMVEEHLVDHPAVQAVPEWKALAEEAMHALFNLYQAIGRDHVG